MSLSVDLPLTSQALAATVGLDESALVQLLGADVSDAAPLSTFRSLDSARLSFRVELGDGTRVKLRRLGDALAIERVGFMRRLSETGQFARVLRTRGRLLVEEWVDGASLALAPRAAATLEAAGALLAHVHVTPPDSTVTESARASTRAFVDAIDADLGTLETARVLDAAGARAIRAAVAAHDPGSTEHGLIHRDFCAENIVVRCDGTLCVVDNEDVRPGAPDGDLIRALQRWPLDRVSRLSFLSGYAHVRNPRYAHRDIVFWSMWSWALSARVRLTAGDEAASRARVASMRRIARLHESGVDRRTLGEECHGN
jgi:hypothetical protein